MHTASLLVFVCSCSLSDSFLVHPSTPPSLHVSKTCVSSTEGDESGSITEAFLKVPSDNHIRSLKLPPTSLDYLSRFRQLYFAMAAKIIHSRFPGSSQSSVVAPKSKDELEVFEDCRQSLERAGYVEVTDRDLEICEALNAGYLLRLSLAPDLSNLDKNLRIEFVGEDGISGTGASLFGGKVVMFRRGYGTEVTDNRRLIIPKLDYLQASLVQKNAATVSDKLSEVQNKLDGFMVEKKEEIAMKLQSSVEESPPNEEANTYAEPPPFQSTLSRKIKESSIDTARRVLDNTDREPKKVKPITLKRYGSGSNPLSVDPSRALEPYLWAPGPEDGEKAPKNSDFIAPRVSISDVVDLFSTGGRRRLIKSLFSKSKLVEPTYQELIVIHRPVVPPLRPPPFYKRIPNFVYNLAEIFNADQKFPKRWEPPPPEIQQAQMKVYTDVPMANVLACLPKSKLVFRPADALRLDLISALSGLAVFATLRFDNPKFDIIAIVSVSLWALRLLFRYSNNLARYDLLVNKFLTSKIANKGIQQVHEFLLNQEALVKARKAAYIYDWLIEDTDVDDRYINEGLGLLQELNIVNQRSKNFVSNSTVVDEELKERWMGLFR